MHEGMRRRLEKSSFGMWRWIARMRNVARGNLDGDAVCGVVRIQKCVDRRAFRFLFCWRYLEPVNAL